MLKLFLTEKENTTTDTNNIVKKRNFFKIKILHEHFERVITFHWPSNNIDERNETLIFLIKNTKTIQLSSVIKDVEHVVKSIYHNKVTEGNILVHILKQSEYTYYILKYLYIWI